MIIETNLEKIYFIHNYDYTTQQEFQPRNDKLVCFFMTLWYRQFLLIPRTTNVFDLEFTICMMFQKSLSNTKLITTFKQKTYIIYTHIHLILNIELLPFKYIYGKEVTPTIPHVLLS